jgi:chromate transporter
VNSEAHDLGADGRSGSERTLRRLVGYFLRLGAYGFGGPIALVGYMRRDLVEQRRWFSDDEYRQGLALAQTMPGPLAAQLAMWLGFLTRGIAGSAAVALAFVAPPFVLVTTVAVIYVQQQGSSWVHALFQGVGPAIVAIIAIASVKLARTTNKRDPLLWAIATGVCAVTVLAGAEIVWLFLLAGIFGAIIYGGGLPTRNSVASLGPLNLLASVKGLALTGTGAGLSTLGLFFLQAGAFTFGSGLAVVPFLHQGLVSDHHWLTEQQFVDCVALGIISPGPVVIIGTVAGYLVFGIIGAVVATVAVFLPAFLLVVLLGRTYRRHADHPRVQGFVGSNRRRSRCNRGSGHRHRATDRQRHPCRSDRGREPRRIATETCAGARARTHRSVRGSGTRRPRLGRQLPATYHFNLCSEPPRPDARRGQAASRTPPTRRADDGGQADRAGRGVLHRPRPNLGGRPSQARDTAFRSVEGPGVIQAEAGQFGDLLQGDTPRAGVSAQLDHLGYALIVRGRLLSAKRSPRARGRYGGLAHGRYPQTSPTLPER